MAEAQRTRAAIERAADALVPRRLARYREQLQYLGVGAWNTLFGYCVWAVLQYTLHDYINYLLIIVLAYPISIANAYVCYRYIVFRSHGRVWREVPRFSTVYLLTMAANLLLLPLAAANPSVQRLRGSGTVHHGGGRRELRGPSVLQLPGRAGGGHRPGE